MEKILVTRPFLPDRAVFDAYVNEIWERNWLTNNGPLHARFKEKLQEFLSAENLTLTVNGHMGLDIVLKGFGIRGEVITTPFTFASTVHALSTNRIHPVFCDIRESDLTLDPECIEPLITEKTTAIMPVHVYGHPCDTGRIEEIARAHGLKVIYDAAHAFGVTVGEKGISSFGDASVFSFHATKLFHSIEGGAIAYSDSNYSRLLEAYRNFGIEGEEKIDYIGMNAKMNEFQAAMGLSVLPYVRSLIEERKEITGWYREHLSEVAGLSFFLPEENAAVQYNYAYFPILIDEKKLGVSRDYVYAHLRERDIYARKYFYPIATQFGCYREEYKDTHLPTAERISRQILCLPLYNGLSREQVAYVCSAILKE
jgi:dTDP-4-amino-4,6-dideoxygalactose transaminase